MTQTHLSLRNYLNISNAGGHETTMKKLVKASKVSFIVQMIKLSTNNIAGNKTGIRARDTANSRCPKRLNPQGAHAGERPSSL